MKVLFNSEQLNFRGTTNSIMEYARYNQEILGNESAIIYNSKNGIGIDVSSEQSVVETVSKLYPVYTYETEKELNDIAEKFDFCYSQRSGVLNDPIEKKKQYVVTSTKFGVHCVFQWYEPHGDRYAYISEWLAHATAKMHNSKVYPHVPYVVNLPEPNENYREKFGISKDKLVIGRIGGYNTFDLGFVQNVVRKIARDRDDILFIFANTRPFTDSPNVIYAESFFDPQVKSNYIHMCDAMLHGRNLGESFGLSVAEFLFHNKPVLTWEGGFDRNHVEMLKNTGLIYGNDEDNLYEMIVSLRERPTCYYKGIVEKYNPTTVMQQFKSVFLD